jgi:tetratricopeptide (TPR) repeat protein
MLCDLLVDRDDWPQLETAARGLLDEATSLRHDPLLALAQRYLGLALVETGRQVEGAELLEAALPVLRDTAPDQLAPAAWALGGALASLGEHDGARTAYATAAMGFEAQDRFYEASHAHLRAGNAAWGEDSSAASVHFDAAVDFAAQVADAPLYAAAVRDRASHRASQGETTAALMELDALVQEVEAMAAAGEQPLEQAYLTQLGLALIRQGAHLLAASGEPASAAERLERAEREAAHDPRFSAICRAERGAVYARMGRLTEAESLVRDGLALLDPAADRDVHVQAAGALAQALHDSGEVEAADHLWEELAGNR